MSWICPWCGTENYQDDRIGRQEPKCRNCKNERMTAEELEKYRDNKTGSIKRDLDKLSDMISGLKETIEFHQSIIEEHTGPLTDAQQELAEMRDEAKPLREELKKLEDLTIFYEERNRELKAVQDPHQSKLPFEVPA